jgi:Subtilisin inhibitor-like
MRVCVVVALAFAMAQVAAASGTTALRIVYRADANATPRVFTLRCDPAGGTVAHPPEACRRLARLGRAAFRPVPTGLLCTQIYGGPQEAIVTGTVAGGRVWATFRRRDGCEIARWSRLGFLFPTPSSP